MIFFLPLQCTDPFASSSIEDGKEQGEGLMPAAEGEAAQWSYCVLLHAKDATHGPNSGQRDTK